MARQKYLILKFGRKMLMDNIFYPSFFSSLSLLLNDSFHPLLVFYYFLSFCIEIVFKDFAFVQGTQNRGFVFSKD